MIEKFDTKKVENQLKKINKEADITNNSCVQLVINNMNIYNDLIDRYLTGDLNKVYILYQLNGQIFKQLKVFGIYPDSKIVKEVNQDDYIFNKVKKNVEKR